MNPDYFKRMRVDSEAEARHVLNYLIEDRYARNVMVTRMWLDGANLKEAGDTIGVSRERARQIVIGTVRRASLRRDDFYRRWQDNKTASFWAKVKAATRAGGEVIRYKRVDK